MNNPFNQDILFDQMANISKAHAYDVIVKHHVELKQCIRELVTALEKAELPEHKELINKAKLISI